MSHKTLNPLGMIRQIVEAVGMGVSYAYEDLVFLEHNAFMLQFTDSETEILVHRNIEAAAEELAGDLGRLQVEAHTAGLEFTEAGFYRLTPVNEGNIQLEFLDE
jgi:hypothetical protein